MYKVVINTCYGGFALSPEAEKLLFEKKGKKVKTYRLPRHDKDLVSVVEELGEAASGMYANLEAVPIAGNKYIIDEYEGFEDVLEPKDIEWIVIGEEE